MIDELSAAKAEVLAFMQQVEQEPEHVTQVTNLSLLLYDQIVKPPSRGDRFLLECAALLHDIGWTLRPTGKGHHKASESMILDHPWKTLPGEQVRLIANIARYHRKTPPKPGHPHFASLPPADQQRVRQLAALLRVGDAMDRSHLQLVQTIACRQNGQTLWIDAVASGDLEVESFGVEKKSDLFEAVFGTPVQLRRVPRLPS